jgi:hypothetical protein
VAGLTSILLATTGRPDMAERCVREARASAVGHRLEIVACVDADPLTRDRLAPLADRVVFREELGGCSSAWNAALAVASGDPLVLAADDLRWGEGWLDAALATLAAFPDGWGFVGFNDAHWGEDLSTHYLMSRRLIVEVFGGRVAWDAYRHSFNDREANDRARAACRYAWCEAAHVGHEHWTWGTRPQDATDTLALPAHPDSERAYQLRRAAGFPNDEPPVITERSTAMGGKPSKGTPRDGRLSTTPKPKPPYGKPKPTGKPKK